MWYTSRWVVVSQKVWGCCCTHRCASWSWLHAALTHGRSLNSAKHPVLGGAWSRFWAAPVGVGRGSAWTVRETSEKHLSKISWRLVDFKDEIYFPHCRGSRQRRQAHWQLLRKVYIILYRVSACSTKEHRGAHHTLPFHKDYAAFVLQSRPVYGCFVRRLRTRKAVLMFRSLSWMYPCLWSSCQEEGASPDTSRTSNNDQAHFPLHPPKRSTSNASSTNRASPHKGVQCVLYHAHLKEGSQNSKALHTKWTCCTMKFFQSHSRWNKRGCKRLPIEEWG